jgi:hypothetical protein
MIFHDLDHFRKLFEYIDSPAFEINQDEMTRINFWTSSGEQTTREQSTNMTFYSEGLYGGVIDIFPDRITISYDNFNYVEDKSLNVTETMQIDTTPFVDLSEEEIFQQSTIQDFDFLVENPDVLKQILLYSLEVRINRRKLNDSNWS